MQRLNDLSSNPWSDQLESLPITTPHQFPPDEILYRISKILNDWHGTPTPTLNPKERQNRLIKAISGYSDIDIGIRPFDWNSHPKSIYALRTSLAIDNYKCLDGKTSLRSELLNLDMNERYSIGKDKSDDNDKRWTTLSANCIALLIIGLSPSLRSQEAILASVFSYENTLGLNGGWLETETILNQLKDVQVPINFHNPPMKPTSDNVSPDVKRKIGLNDTGVTPEEKEIYNNYKKWKQEVMEIEKFKKYSFPRNQNLYEVEFKFYRIQNWINELLRYDQSEATAQRIIRGASLILESVISEIRDVAIDDYGPGAIIVDGGGRLLISVRDKNQAEEFKQKIIVDRECVKCGNMIYSRFSSFLAVPNPSSRRLERELGIWFEKITSQETNLVESMEKKMENLNMPASTESEKCPLCKQVTDKTSKGYIFREKISKFANYGLPPRRIHIRETRRNKEINDKHSLLEALQKWGEPPIRKVDNISGEEKCPYSDEETSENADWKKIDGWMDSDYSVSIKKYGLWVNDTHRLVYLIGRYQRIKDSILNMPSKMNGKLSSEFFPLVKDRRLEGKKFVNRKLSELAKIDGNIVGEIFSLDVHEYYSQDMKRRRSFRFNSHWWDSLFTAMQETEFIAGDPIAQYAAAGDDILLGHYSISGREDENFLLFYLEKLSKQVQKRLNIELKNAVGNKNGLFFSFAGGYIKKQNQTLKQMMTNVNHLEKYSKQAWRHYMTKHKPEIIPLKKRILDKSKLTFKDFNGNYVGIYDESSSIKDEKSVLEPITYLVDWPEYWNNSELEKMVTKLKLEILLKNSQFLEIYEILTRCETTNIRVDNKPLIAKIIRK